MDDQTKILCDLSLVAEILHYVQDDNAWHRGTDSVDKLTRLPWLFVIRISLFLRPSSFVIYQICFAKVWIFIFVFS